VSYGRIKHHNCISNPGFCGVDGIAGRLVRSSRKGHESTVSFRQRGRFFATQSPPRDVTLAIVLPDASALLSGQVVTKERKTRANPSVTTNIYSGNKPSLPELAAYAHTAAIYPSRGATLSYQSPNRSSASTAAVRSYPIPFGGGVEIIREPALSKSNDIITVAVRIAKQRRLSDEGADALPER